MRRIGVFLMLMATTALIPAGLQAQTHDHGSVNSVSAPAILPGSSWLSIEENLRNLTDALKQGDVSMVSTYVAAMSGATDDLLAANIHNEVKPQEEEHLLNSLESLKLAVDHLVEVSATGDKAALEAAINQVAGAVTLTRIDVPPGLLEKISGASVRAEIVNTPTLQKGKPETVTLRLKSAITGKPLKPEDLIEVHAGIVHAYIIDPLLGDYTHEHPLAIDVPGEYTFNLTPKTDCTYRLWADVTLAKGQQEYAMVDIPGKDGCGALAIDKTESVSSTVDGMTVDLKIPETGLALDKEATLAFEIKNEAGEPVGTLEPIMGAYAHVVGFYEDFRKITHLHPIEDKPQMPDDRVVSPLLFHFKPEKSGAVKLFMRVQIDGAIHTFPFTVSVKG